jgi:asparagine synthase (glutamine-hydrolysing)
MYYGTAGGHIVFGSELKPLRAHGGLDLELDRTAVDLFLRHSFIPAPYSILRDVKKLPAGSIVSFSSLRPARDPQPRRYWTLEPGPRVPLALDEADALLADAVKLRMHADVPLGAFLSGGIDSSLTVALMQKQATIPVRTFTIAMPDAGLDESAEARAVADYLGTNHTSVTLGQRDALELVPRLPELYDEPFADPSQLPMTLVARVARRDVTVALSGDGGDEVFGGYNRYAAGRTLWRTLKPIPTSVRRAAARTAGAVPHSAWDKLDSLLRDRVRRPADKAQKLAGLLDASDVDDLYLRLISAWDTGAPPPTELVGAVPDGLEPAERMMWFDTQLSLPDEMLAKVDRATMANSLEARVPLLDHRVIERAWRLPVEARTNKRLLKDVLARHLPADLVDRPKLGFDPPIGNWLRKPLRGWAEDLLDAAHLRDHGLVDVELVRATWDEHQSGRRNHDYRMWAVLMLEAWLDAWRP